MQAVDLTQLARAVLKLHQTIAQGKGFLSRVESSVTEWPHIPQPGASAFREGDPVHDTGKPLRDKCALKTEGHHISALRFSRRDQQPMSICREGVTLTVPRFESGMC